MSYVNGGSMTGNTADDSKENSILTIQNFAVSAMKMLGDFVVEANGFLDELWEEAEKLGYQRSSDTDALRLVSYFFFDICKAHPEDRDSVYRSFSHPIEEPPSELHLILGSALAMYFIAVTEYSIKCLILAWRCLEASRKETGSNVAKAISEMARKGAAARHKETYQLKAEAQKYWRDNIGLAVSNDKAAELLTSVFPISFRKLSDYVAEAKREVKRSAGKT